MATVSKDFIVKNGIIVSNTITSTDITTTSAGGGSLYLNGSNNRIDFNNSGFSAPTFTTISTGTKIVLYPNVGAAAVDFALGIDYFTMWSSVPTSAYQFKWYAGTTSVASLSGAGTFSTTNISYTGTLTGGTGILNIGSGQVYKDASGNVGIGTSSLISGNPSGSLTAAGVLSASGYLNTNQTNKAVIQMYSNIMGFRSYGATSGTGQIAFSVGGGGGNTDAEAMRINSSGNVGIGTSSPVAKLDIVTPSALPTADTPYGLSITNTSLKTYPTTSSFQAYPAFNQNIELGTSQTIDTTLGVNFVYGIRSKLTKSAGSTSDIERLYFNGFAQNFVWTDLNTCRQYIGIVDTFSYAGIDANTRISSGFNAKTVFLIAPASGTQTVGNVSAETLLIRNSNANVTYNITSATGQTPKLMFLGTAGNITATIGTYTAIGLSTSWGSYLSGASSSATITNFYGLRLPPPASSTNLTITNRWGISQEDALAVNSFAGNVGIGASSPAYKLDIQGNAAGQFWASIKNTNAGASSIGGWIFGNDTYSDVGGVFAGSSGGGGFGGANSMNIGSWKSAPLAMFTNNTERMRIDSSGNVGIGTSSPAVKLDINSQGVGAVVRVGDYTAVAQSAWPLIESFGNRNDANTTFYGRFGASKRRSDGTAIASGNSLGAYAFGGQWGTDTSYQSAKNLYAASIIGVSESSFTSATTMSTAIVFNTGSTGGLLSTYNTTYGTERMRIDSSGNVGIGTTTPLYRIDVTNTGGAGYSPTTARFNDTGNEAGITINNTATSGRAYTLLSTGGTSGLGVGKFIIADATTGVTRLSIDSSGNVGIGTSSPSYKLDVRTSGDAVQIFASNGTVNQAVGYCSSGQALSGTISNHPVVFIANNTERMRINSTGNVGIGTSSPLEKLQVTNGNISIYNPLSTTNYLKFVSGYANNTTSYIAGINEANWGGRLLSWVGRPGGGAGAQYGTVQSVYDDPTVGYPNQNTHVSINVLTTTANQTSILYVGTGSTVTNTRTGLYVETGAVLAGTTGNVGIGTSSPAYKLQVNGSFAATTKSFVIDHPTKEGMKLRYGSLESPYHGVRLTGEGVLINGTATVKLPYYIHGLCKQEGSQVQITNIKHGKVIWVDDVNVDEDCFVVKSDILVHDESEYKFYWSFTAIRKDIEDMVVEFAE